MAAVVPGFVGQLRSRLDVAAASHEPLLRVEHEYFDQEPAPMGGVVFGWGSRVVLQDAPDQPQVYFWYDGFDADVMFWGDLGDGGWFPHQSPAAAAQCLQAADSLVHRLATDQAQAVAAAARRVAADARGERLLRRARWLRSTARRLRQTPAPD